MTPRLQRGAALLAALALAACSEQQTAPTAPTAPTFASDNNTAFPCDFNGLTSLINIYVKNNTQQQKVQSLKDEMKTAWTATNVNTTRERGFDILREFGIASGTGDPAIGASAANGVFQCMLYNLNDTNLFPTFPLPLQAPLTPSQGGAF